MKRISLFFLPLLLVASIVSAQQGLLTISINDEHLTAQVDCSAQTQELVNDTAHLKAIFQQADDQFMLEIYTKNENGEWELLRTLELPVSDNAALSKGIAIPSVDGIVILQIIE